MKGKGKTKPSAVPGTVQTIDIEAIRLSARRRTELEMQRTAPPYERKGDGVDWARLILARIERGDDVGLRPEQLAKEALAMVPVREPGEEG
jgi:hypothetical protein